MHTPDVEGFEGHTEGAVRGRPSSKAVTVSSHAGVGNRGRGRVRIHKPHTAERMEPTSERRAGDRRDRRLLAGCCPTLFGSSRSVPGLQLVSPNRWKTRVYDSPKEFNAKFARADCLQKHIYGNRQTVDGFEETLAMAYWSKHTPEARSLPGYPADETAGMQPKISGDTHA